MLLFDCYDLLCYVLHYFQVIVRMVPEAWQNDAHMPEQKKAFYRWSAYTMEPWDGPGKYILTLIHPFTLTNILTLSSSEMLTALFTFTDGRYIGAILDRNGLRPSRYYITKSNHMYMASEVGVTDLDPSEIVSKVEQFVLNHFVILFHQQGYLFSGSIEAWKTSVSGHQKEGFHEG